MAENFGEHMANKLHDLNPNKVPSAVGISWYSRRTYLDCVRMFDDSDGFHDTYEEWFQKADETVKDLQRQGLKVVKAKIDPVEFPKWCEENGIENLDKHARTAYGNAVAMSAIQKNE